MKIGNKRAKFDYSILDYFEAGVRLTGPEVKSIKSGRMKLEGSFVRIMGGELFLVNAAIPRYEFARQKNYNPNRSRKLLMHKREIIALASKIKRRNLTLVPILCYTKQGVIKVRIGLAKGKKKYEKRRAERKRAIERKLEKELGMY